MVSSIQDRVALLTRLPVLHQEMIQVLRYGKDQYCHKHKDILPDGDAAGQRVATILIYLADSEEGGEVRD